MRNPAGPLWTQASESLGKLHAPNVGWTGACAALTLTTDHFVGLKKLVFAAGHTAGAIYQVTVNGRTRNVSWGVLGQDIGEEDS